MYKQWLPHHSQVHFGHLNQRNILIDIGLGGSYTVQDRFQTYATINFAPRYKKALSMGVNTYIGARVLFD